MAATSVNVQPRPAVGRVRRRAQITIGLVTLGSLVLFVDLLLANHTTGEEIWGPITAALGVTVGILSLVFLATGRRNTAIRLTLIVFWAIVAFFGYGGYNEHRLPSPPDTVADQRPRPPLAPLSFTALGIVGGAALWVGSRRREPGKDSLA